MFVAQAKMQLRLLLSVREIARQNLRKFYVLAFSVVKKWNSMNFRID